MSGNLERGGILRKPIKIAVLLSGSGSTLENLFEKMDSGFLEATIDIVISSKIDAYGLQRAERHGVETVVVESKKFYSGHIPDWEGMSAAISDLLLPRKVDLVCLCGFMCFYQVPEELSGRVMNVHPALIPSFCGKGMYGSKVHEAVKRAGVKLSGCTVHFVNNQYDAGPIIIQRSCPVYDTDSVSDIASRVMEQERIAYPEAVRLFAQGRLRINEGIVEIRD